MSVVSSLQCGLASRGMGSRLCRIERMQGGRSWVVQHRILSVAGRVLAVDHLVLCMRLFAAIGVGGKGRKEAQEAQEGEMP